MSRLLAKGKWHRRTKLKAIELRRQQERPEKGERKKFCFCVCIKLEVKRRHDTMEARRRTRSWKFCNGTWLRYPLGSVRSVACM